MSAGAACTAACGFCGRCTPGSRLRAVCPQCKAEYVRSRADDGWLCDRCCDRRDFHRSDKKRMATAVLPQKRVVK